MEEGDMRLKVLAIGIISLIGTLPAFAHHSFAAEFDEEKPLTLKGVISKVEWQNPHVYFYIDTKNGQGATETWGFESSGTAMLRHSGWTRETLKVGDRVTVTGYVAKDGAHLLGARQTEKLVVLPDGSKFFGGAASDKDSN
jgi:hypothetical protein